MLLTTLFIIHFLHFMNIVIIKQQEVHLNTTKTQRVKVSWEQGNWHSWILWFNCHLKIVCTDHPICSFVHRDACITFQFTAGLVKSRRTSALHSQQLIWSSESKQVVVDLCNCAGFRVLIKHWLKLYGEVIMQFWKNPEKRYCGTLVATPAHQNCVGEAEQVQNSKLDQKNIWRNNVLKDARQTETRRGLTQSEQSSWVFGASGPDQIIQTQQKPQSFTFRQKQHWIQKKKNKNVIPGNKASGFNLVVFKASWLPRWTAWPVVGTCLVFRKCTNNIWADWRKAHHSKDGYCPESEPTALSVPSGYTKDRWFCTFSAGLARPQTERTWAPKVTVPLDSVTHRTWQHKHKKWLPATTYHKLPSTNQLADLAGLHLWGFAVKDGVC